MEKLKKIIELLNNFLIFHKNIKYIIYYILYIIINICKRITIIYNFIIYICYIFNINTRIILFCSQI